MSYYFCIVGTRDQPVFELELGTSKQGGDGVPRFSQDARQMNPFIVHAALDYVDELQWTNTQMYLKRVDHFASAHISTFLTPTSTRFMLLHLPHLPNQIPQTPQLGPTTFPPFAPFTSNPIVGGGGLGGSGLGKSSSSSANSSSIPNNATSPQTEEAIRGFFGEVFEVWIKAIMNPFTTIEDRIVSPMFRQRVVAAGKKYL